MTPRTRRRLFLALLVVALTVPAETILLQALQSPDDQTAARRWVATLSGPALENAATHIEGYSFLVRRELMRNLPPVVRAATWRRHLQKYVDAHPTMDAQGRAVIAAAMEALTPAALSAPTDATRASLSAVGEQLAVTFGQETAEELAVWLGPRQVGFTNALEPLLLKLSSKVRNTFTVFAQDPACDCNREFGCYLGASVCDATIFCRPEDNWPSCGWFWGQECNGFCISGQ